LTDAAAAGGRTQGPGLGTNAPRGLIAYDPNLEDEIFAFQRAAYPRRRSDWIAPRWRWMFLESAQRLGVHPLVWLYRTREGIAGHQGVMPVTLQIDQAERVTGWFVETMVLESVRGKAVGPAVVARTKRDLPFNLSLGQTPQMRALQFSLGWQQVCSLPTYTFVLSPWAVLEGKLPGWSRPAAAAALGLWQRARWLRGRRRLTWRPEIREIAQFDDAHDALWAAVRRAYRCAVVRDASYLNWKYVAQPGQNFVRLEVRRNGQPVGVAVLAFLEPDQAYRYPRALLVDVVVSLDEPDVVWATFEAVRRAAVARGAALVSFDLAGPLLASQTLTFGFSERPPLRFLLVSVEGVAEADARTVLDTAAWFVTHGDSDNDRPW
jgi:hypothetical protein